MKITFSITMLLFASISFCQNNPTKKAQPIVEEGKKLYKSEMASWYGTDAFLAEYENRENIGGYFSYSEDENSNCIFFSNKVEPTVIGTITFDNTFSIENAKIDLSEREFTAYERDLFEMRQNSLIAIQSDTLFKTYENTNLNLIPLINGKEKKVYILTGPQEHGVVIFGNDYLITLDKNNRIKSKKQLHRNIIPIRYDVEGQDSVVEAMHSHTEETGDFITATDVCTLMLYSKFVGWEKHTVISKEYMNLWNCETNTLTVLPRKLFDKINSQEE